MPVFTFRQRLKIALGGLASFSGMIVFACALLTATGAANLVVVFQEPAFIFLAVFVAALDAACGLLIVFSNKEIVLSLRPEQNKTSNNAD